MYFSNQNETASLFYTAFQLLAFWSNQYACRFAGIHACGMGQFVGMDPFESLYFLNSNVLFKKNSQGLQNYSDLNKGAISEVSVFNALKLALFYKDFNTVTLLDNRLAELIAIDFNTL